MEDFEFLLKLLFSLSLNELYEKLLMIEVPFPLDGEADLSVYKKRGKTIYLIHGAHFSKEALDLMHNVIKPMVKENNKDWLFLIEGTPPVGIIPEVVYPYILAKKLFIPIENQIVDPFSKEVVDIAIRNDNDILVYTALCLALININNDINKIINKFSKEWGLSKIKKQALEENINRLIGLNDYDFSGMDEDVASIVKASVKVDRISHLANSKEVYKVMKKVTKISNELSFKKLKKILSKKEYKDKKRILAYNGRLHKEIFDIL